jgi:hypothetical protein
MSTTVDIASYTTEGEAQLAKTQLDDAGIPSMIAGTGQPGFPAGMFSNTAASVRLQVAEENVDAARAVLDAHEDGASSA